MYRGTPDEWNPCKDWMKELPHKHKFFIPGNHDYFPELYAGLARNELRRQCGVKIIPPNDPLFTLPNGMRAMGCSYTTGLSGWAYCETERGVEEWLDIWTGSGYCPDLMVTHAPPYNILDAVMPDKTAHKDQEHAGGLALNRWFHKRRDAGEKVPLIWLCGHIHESYGHTNVGGTHFYNTSMCDRKYEQSNEPVIIDL